MFFGSPKAIAMAGATLALAVSQAAAAQSNPFLPSAGASKAEIEAIAEAKVKAMVAEGVIGNGAGSSGASPPVAGVAGAPPIPCPVGSPVGPGAPVGGMSGNCVPGGMMPPDAFGEAGAVQVPLGAVAQKLETGARFIGCINGVPKFALKNGTRLTFSKTEISEGVEAGVIPACR